MDETPAAHHPTRRWLLAGGIALVVGGGVGVGAGFVHDDRRGGSRRDPLPQALAAALADERRLLAAATAASSVAGVGTRVAATLVRDHRAHLAALTAAASGYERADGSASAAPPSPASSEPRSTIDREQLRRIERDAARTDGTRATHLGAEAPAIATVLASIAACHATHAELLGTRS